MLSNYYNIGSDAYTIRGATFKNYLWQNNPTDGPVRYIKNPFILQNNTKCHLKAAEEPLRYLHVRVQYLLFMRDPILYTYTSLTKRHQRLWLHLNFIEKQFQETNTYMYRFIQYWH